MRRTDELIAIRDWNLNYNLGTVVINVIKGGNPAKPDKEALIRAKMFLDFELKCISEREVELAKEQFESINKQIRENKSVTS